MLKCITALMFLFCFYSTCYGELIYISNGQIYIDLPRNYVKLSKDEIEKNILYKDLKVIAAYKNDTGNIIISLRAETNKGTLTVDNDANELLKYLKNNYEEPISAIDTVMIKGKMWIRIMSTNEPLGFYNINSITNFGEKIVSINISVSSSVFGIYRKDLAKISNSFFIQNKKIRKPVRFSLLSTSVKQ